MQKVNKTIFFLLVFTVLFIFIRSINYIYHLYWSGDQARCGIEALKIFRTKTLTLIGPEISATFQGRFIFQGPITYYFYLLFLLFGRWDPVVSSYLFMIFCSLMIFPLFFGTKKLINEKVAWFMVIIYTLVPYYINYTRFLWNSTFLFSLVPILIYLMGQYTEKKSPLLFFLISFWLGLLLQFHYQFILVILGIFLYYFLYKKLKIVYLPLFIFGIAFGLSPLILFELRHGFYNLKTMILFMQNWDKVAKPGGIATPHYYISSSFMAILALSGLLKKFIDRVSYKYFFVGIIFFIVYSFFIYVPKPEHAFWAYTSPWNYLAEKKIYDTIKQTGLKKNFNIANLAYYDTLSTVVKYFMKRYGYNIAYDDYYNNKYLFVISEKNKYLSHPAYEISTFKPFKILNQWKINNSYNMLLLKREKK